MEELSEQQIIDNCLSLGECIILTQETWPNSNKSRVTKSRHNWEHFTVEQRIEYVNSISSSSINAVKKIETEVIYE